MADDPKNDQIEEKTDEKEEETAETPADTPEVKSEVTTEDTSEVSEAETEEIATPASPVRNDKPKKPVEDTERSRSISANLEKIIEQIEKLSVLELADLVHGLEDRFGVSAQAPVATVPVGTGQAGAGEPQEEKTTFNVILSATGVNKIAVIKAVRELVPTLGLKEAKDLVEAAPKPVLEGVNKVTAEEAKAKLTAAGGTVELQ